MVNEFVCPEKTFAGSASYTIVILDVEAIPDRDFFYLIGVRFDDGEGVVRHHLWADEIKDEEKIWRDFLAILSRIENPVLLHYGSFENTFLRKMCDRYGRPPEDSGAARAIRSSINVLSVMFARVYFPTYSNGLKEIARFLGFEWTDPIASGLQSIAWRHQWEESRDAFFHDKLITYNIDDCAALNVVTQFLRELTQSNSGTAAVPAKTAITRVETLSRNVGSKWQAFHSPLPALVQVNAAAYWSYQRDRVFVRSGTAKRKSDGNRSQASLINVQRLWSSSSGDFGNVYEKGC